MPTELEFRMMYVGSQMSLCSGIALLFGNDPTTQAAYGLLVGVIFSRTVYRIWLELARRMGDRP